ncbi:hypothetical protein PoB_006928500 [Plakobranchus ocellatus]|uniref:Uncharacterized protein n=1 Tax=Plakobranchus ocellatus TaxID=259542 RepID=A0AAV4DFJ2_9GAST|nr:hypothetical protein PoB_006928500 [Plakobranchus ocellatus]
MSSHQKPNHTTYQLELNVCARCFYLKQTQSWCKTQPQEQTKGNNENKKDNDNNFKSTNKHSKNKYTNSNNTINNNNNIINNNSNNGKTK